VPKILTVEDVQRALEAAVIDIAKVSTLRGQGELAYRPGPGLFVVSVCYYGRDADFKDTFTESVYTALEWFSDVSEALHMSRSRLDAKLDASQT